MAARLTTFLVVGIVAVTFIAGLIVGAQRDDYDGPVDLIVYNARMYTADEDRSMAEAVAIRGNQILRVGSNREISRLRRPQTTVIDAKGAAVLPGFNDAHLDLIAGGLTFDAVDLQGVSEADAIQERLKTYAAANPTRAWVRAQRWSEASFSGVPTRQLLDAAVSERPVMIVADEDRTAWVNTAALKLAGITRRTPNPEDGAIVRDPRGEATGVLRGAAVAMMERVIPPAATVQRAAALRAAIDAANRHGITSVQTVGDSVEDLELYDAARRAGDLTVRVYGALSMSEARLADAEVARIGEIARKYPDDPRFKTGAARVRIDGAIESHTASLLEPFSDNGTTADPVIGSDDLNRNVRILDSYGWQVMAHASGDRAVNMALNAYAHAARSNAAPSRGRRHRIEHAAVVAETDFARFRSLSVIASMQPRQARSDLWVSLLGPERFDRANAMHTLSAAGARLAFGSEWPEGPLDPLAVLLAATGRDDDDDRTAAPDRVSLKDAIDAYTTGAAYASFDEQRKGSITPGMLADLVVLSDNIFAASAPSLSSTKVAVTIFDGKVVYRRAATN